jgi:hypothetical protein
LKSDQPSGWPVEGFLICCIGALSWALRRFPFRNPSHRLAAAFLSVAFFFSSWFFFVLKEVKINRKQQPH